jgi:WD40 repeat protein
MISVHFNQIGSYRMNPSFSKLRICLTLIVTVLSALLCCSSSYPQESVEIVPQTGHSDGIRAIQFSPNGRTFVTAGLDKFAILWNSENGKQLRSFVGHSWQVMAATFSRDGKTLATGSTDYNIRIWNTDSGQTERILTGHRHWVIAVGLSPDGGRLISGSMDETARLWDVRTGRQLRELRAHKGQVDVAVFSPDGDRIATGGLDGKILIYDGSASTVILQLSMESSISGLVFSPDETMIAGIDDRGNITVWNLITRGVVYSLLGRRDDKILSVAFSSNGLQLLWSSELSVLSVFAIDQGKIIRIVVAPQTVKGQEILAAAISVDRDLLVTGNEVGALRIWNLTSENSFIAGGKVLDAAVVKASSDMKYFMIGSARTAELAIWDSTKGMEVTRVKAQTSGLFSGDLSQGGEVGITGGADDAARIWSLPSGALRHELKGHGGAVAKVAISFDGRFAISAGQDLKVRVWDVKSGELLRTLSVRPETS